MTYKWPLQNGFKISFLIVFLCLQKWTWTDGNSLLSKPDKIYIASRVSAIVSFSLAGFYLAFHPNILHYYITNCVLYIQAIPFFNGAILLEFLICWLKGVETLRLNDGLSSVTAGIFLQLSKYVLALVIF